MMNLKITRHVALAITGSEAKAQAPKKRVYGSLLNMLLIWRREKNFKFSLADDNTKLEIKAMK